MSGLFGCFQASIRCDVNAVTTSRRFVVMWWLVFVVFGLAAHKSCFAESQTGSNGASAKIDFRIVIPAIIRVTAVSQPDNIVIEDRHITQGYVDLDAGTSVKLTTNTRDGYLLSASYDSQLLSSVEVRVSSQNLTVSSGAGSMRVASGLVIDKLIAFGYRLHLARGAQKGVYRWPVALAFSLVAA